MLIYQVISVIALYLMVEGLFAALMPQSKPLLIGRIKSKDHRKIFGLVEFAIGALILLFVLS